MNRILRRPMFRTGGSAEGITSGLAPRQGYYKGRTVNPFERTGNLPGGAYNRNSNVNTPLPGSTPNESMSMMDKLQFQKSMIENLAPRTPRKDTSMRDFLINFGLDIASRPPSGSIFSTAAAAAKEPFGKFQQAKQIEEAYGMKETEADRALITSLIKGMDDDKLSALMKDVKAGVEAGEFSSEAEGIKLLLRKKIYGVLDMPGEADTKRINDLERDIKIADPKSLGYARKVAEHVHKMQTGGYSDDIQKELNQSKIYIKPRHWAGTKVDEDGEIIEIVIKKGNDYPKGIYFEPTSGNLFKMVSELGEAPRFVKVIPD